MPAQKTKADRHKYNPMQIRLPPIYRERMDQLSKRTRRTVTEEAKIAFEKYLAENGLWDEATAE